jgi:hypothetical protein
MFGGYGGVGMRKPRWLVPVLAVVTLMAVLALVGAEIWGGVSRSATSILRHGDRVEVFRVSDRTKASDWSRGDIGGYPILAVGREQGPDFAARLGRVLRGWGVANSSKTCAFEPGVAFRVWRGGGAVEVLVCFKCDDLWPHVVGEPGTLQHEWLEFDAARPALVALAKEAFPDDPTIQALPAVRPTDDAYYFNQAASTTTTAGTTTTTAAEPGVAPERKERNR